MNTYNILFEYFSETVLISAFLCILTAFLVFLILFCALANWIIKNTAKIIFEKEYNPTKFYLATKLVGTLLIAALCFAANIHYVYFLSIIIVATLITDLEFLKEIAAIISNSRHYYDYKKAVINTEDKIKNQKDLQANTTPESTLVAEIQKKSDNYLLLFHFERIYRISFGSQLKLLDNIFKSGGKLSLIEVKKWYQNTTWINVYPFEDYTGFLTNAYFLDFNTELKTYEITLMGKQFLFYLTQNNMSLNKVG